MDIIFETNKGKSFIIEIGYFDSVLEIKEKIQKYKDIPISQQTLVFNGKVLDDDGDVESCVLLDCSRVKLFVSSPTALEKLPHDNYLKIKTEEQQLSPVNNVPNKTQLVFKFQTAKNVQFSVDVDLNDSVEQMKEKLHEIEGHPAQRLALYVNGNHELQDHRHLREYELTDGSVIEVSFKQPPALVVSGMTSTMSTGPKKIKVMVITKCGTRKVLVEVNPTDKVQVLRDEMEKWQQRVKFQLPPEGYFFIYNQNVMEERETFQWHNVRHGDTIEMFNGSVTGGL